MFQSLEIEYNMETHLRLSMRGWMSLMSVLCLRNMNEDGKSRSYEELLLVREEERGMGRDWWKCEQEMKG